MASFARSRSLSALLPHNPTSSSSSFSSSSSSSSFSISRLQPHRSFTSSKPQSKQVQDAYIISAARTPVGVFGGGLASLPAPQLASFAIKAALSRTSLPVEQITAAYIGNVLSGGMGQAPARQAVIASGFSTSVEATTVNKVCSSGLKAVALASQQIALGLEAAVLAGGMESMSQVPYYVPRGSLFPAFGHVSMRDGIIGDGLWDPYNNVHMGNCAESTVKKYKISREAQDAYAIESYRRAGEAWEAGRFASEIAPVTVKGRKGDTVVEKDEGYSRLKPEKVPTLKPAFVRDGSGSVTAANSSGLSDGASALILTNAQLAREHAQGSKVLARIVATADAAMDPIDFPIAPAKAVPIALERAGLEAKDIAAWEINEAFAAVVIANAQILGLDNDKDMEKVNGWGGAISLGHAIGSSGARILTTLLHRLKVGEYGVAAICNGGGASSVMVVQRVDHV